MTFPRNLVRPLSTDFVDEDLHLNNNWDAIDTDFSMLTGQATTTPPAGPGLVMGQEWINSAGKHMVYTGAAWVESDVETWGSWVTLTLTAPYFPRSGLTPSIRISSHKNVEMRGVVQADNVAGAFPNTGVFGVINSGQFTTTYLPEMREVFLAAMHVASGATVAPQGSILVTTLGGSLNVSVIAQGARTGNNYMSLDQVRYKAA